MSEVHWTIDIDEAASPVDAAIAAFFHMQRRYTSANVFDVFDEHGKQVHVDLQELRETDPAIEALMESHDQQERVYYVLALMGDGTPATQGPFLSEQERNAGARSIVTHDRVRRRSLYYVKLSPMNFEVCRFTPSDLDD